MLKNRCFPVFFISLRIVHQVLFDNFSRHNFVSTKKYFIYFKYVICEIFYFSLNLLIDIVKRIVIINKYFEKSFSDFLVFHASLKKRTKMIFKL